jgi:hypothetical protein
MWKGTAPCGNRVDIVILVLGNLFASLGALLLLWAVVSGMIFWGMEWGGDHRWPFVPLF